MASENTSWGGVASWYDEYLNDDDTYQAQVIWPNLKRILNIEKGAGEKGKIHLLDLACGQGYFSFLAAHEGAHVVGLDIAPELVQVAKSRLLEIPQADMRKRLAFDVTPSHELDMVLDKSQDLALCVLALQNIKELDKTFSECARVLKKGGRFVFVLNHPSFRVPQYSDWHFDTKNMIQSRMVWKYMQEMTIPIDMNPGTKKGNMAAKKLTYSFHRPLQLFIKLLTKNGFVITKLEEWCSHKKTEAGPRKEAEDKARKEIPLFMCIEASILDS